MPFKDPVAAREYKRTYARAWRAEHPEEVQRANHAYRSRHRDALVERARQSRRNDPEKGRLAAKEYARRNPEKVRESARRRKLADPAAVAAVQRRSRLKKQYGLSVEGYEQLLIMQHGVCAICGEHCPTGRKLAVDHCHTTGHVRGLLCANCNQGLGKFQDDAELLRKAVAYLLKRTSCAG